MQKFLHVYSFPGYHTEENVYSYPHLQVKPALYRINNFRNYNHTLPMLSSRLSAKDSFDSHL
jgi:hypothetical protein